MSHSDTHPAPLAPEEVDGPFLRKHRRLAGVKQHDVARRAGISAPYLSRIERGERPVDMPLVVRIVDAIAESAGAR